MAYGKRVDSTHAAIRDGLRQVGVLVFDTSGSAHTRGGKGGPDLVCFARGRWTPLWVKRPKGRKTATETNLIAGGVELVFVESVEQALSAVGI